MEAMHLKLVYLHTPVNMNASGLLASLLIICTTTKPFNIIHKLRRDAGPLLNLDYILTNSGS